MIVSYQLFRRRAIRVMNSKIFFIFK